MRELAAVVIVGSFLFLCVGFIGELIAAIDKYENARMTLRKAGYEHVVVRPSTEECLTFQAHKDVYGS